jgi:hypothetical protein
VGLITISAELPNLESIIDSLENAKKNGLTYTKAAVRSATQDVVQRTWLQYASGATVNYSGGTFKVNVISGQYLRSIQEGLRFPSDLTGEVFTTAPHATTIEDGMAPYDMKPGLLSGPKVKFSKPDRLGNRARYITVAFRHGTPGSVGLPAMPRQVYDQAKQLGYSRKNGAVKAFFTGNKYVWNDRLQKSLEGQRSHSAPHPGAGYTWSTGKYSGMVKVGSEKHSQYLTFRRVSTNSDPRSWQHPGVKPRPVSEAVAENTRNEVLQLIRRGFEMDLYFMGLGGE